MEMIKRGAEAEIYLTEWYGRKVIIKKRVRKGYRIKDLDDKIRERRTKREAMLMVAARKVEVNTPIIYDLIVKKKEIVMQYVSGQRIKDVIDKKSENWQKKTCKEIGRSIACMHKNGLIHGDITTSNMILMKGKLYFIDFGLGMKNSNTENIGVDLHVLMEAFKATHKNKNLFKWVIEEYEKNFGNAKEIMKKIEDIVRRGRYMRKVT
jgi:TP53 regulating kinase-like protein